MKTFAELFSTIARLDDASFAGPTDSAKVDAAERQLSVRFPPSFRQFLLQLGCGFVDSEEFCGIPPLEGPGHPNFVWLTQVHRTHGLPEPLVVVQVPGGEDILCIDTRRIDKDEESPIVVWIPGAPADQQDMTPLYPNFAEFVVGRIQRWEELGPIR